MATSVAAMVAVIASAVAIGCGQSATAVPPPPDMATAMAALAEVYPAWTPAQRREAVRAWTPGDGTAYDAAIFLVRAHAPNHPFVAGQSQAHASRPISRWTPLPRGRGSGDLFVHLATGIGALTIGHAGMFVNESTVVHATGLVQPNGTKQGVVKQRRNTVRMPVGFSALLWVNTSSRVRGEAVRFATARAHWHARYSDNYWNNKHVYASAYNCSQLVWAAYKASNVDVDGGTIVGDSWVSPQDILRASETHLYMAF